MGNRNWPTSMWRGRRLRRALVRRWCDLRGHPYRIRIQLSPGAPVSVICRYGARWRGWDEHGKLIRDEGTDMAKGNRRRIRWHRKRP